MEEKWYNTPIDCKSCGSEFIRHQYNQTKCIFCLRKEDSRFSFDKLTKICKGCEKEFVRNSPQQSFCTEQCRQDNAYLQSRYGITKSDYERMLDAQNRVCLICERDDSQVRTRMHLRLVVDHCHTTGEVRGLLCHKCNQALGLLEDSVNSIQNALDYLGRFEKV